MQYHSISDGYFETMGGTLIEGRAFSASDTPESEAVVIVNETLAKRYFPGVSAVGRTLRETPAQVGPLLDRYASVVAGRDDGRQTWKQLRALNQLGVTRGTLQLA